jgi:hypothetical protein
MLKGGPDRAGGPLIDAELSLEPAQGRTLRL